MTLGMVLDLGIVQCYAKCYVNWILVFVYHPDKTSGTKVKSISVSNGTILVQDQCVDKDHSTW